MLLLSKLCRTRVIVFFHGWDHAFEKRLRRHFLWLFRLVYSQADAFIVLAQDFARRLNEMGCCSPVFVESTCVSEEFFATVFDPVPNAVRTPLHSLLFLARVEKEKGIYETYEAYKLLRQMNCQVRLVIAGDGSELSAIRGLVAAEETPGVEFQGYVTGGEKLKVLTDADVYILLSASEGMPLSLLEAMASGLPVITSAVGAIPEFFVDGRMGFLVKDVTPQTVAALLIRLINNDAERQNMSEVNRRFARSHFAARPCIERLERIYLRVLSGRCYRTSLEWEDSWLH